MVKGQGWEEKRRRGRFDQNDSEELFECESTSPSTADVNVLLL